MPGVLYNDELLRLIADNDWREPELNLSDQGLNSENVIALAAVLAKNNHIKILNLSFNSIDTEGAQALAQNKILISLDMGNNIIGDAGAIALATNKTLTTLNLSYNNIHEAGVIPFFINTTLIELTIIQNNIDDSICSILEKRIQLNIQHRENFLLITPLLAFLRVNNKHPLQYSIIALLPSIAKLAGCEYQSNDQRLINIDRFIDSCFAKVHINPESLDTESQQQAVANSAEKMSRQPT